MGGMVAKGFWTLFLQRQKRVGSDEDEDEDEVELGGGVSWSRV